MKVETRSNKTVSLKEIEMVKKMKASEIRIDPVFAEIRNHDSYTCSKYQVHMRNGVKFPPIVVETKTRYLIDGDLRLRAAVAVYGPDAVVDVEFVRCPGFGDRVAEFTRRNISHGRPLDAFTKAKITLALRRRRWSLAKVAELMGVGVENVKRLEGRICWVAGNANATVPQKLAYKAGSGLGGKTVSSELYNEHREHFRGITVTSLAVELEYRVVNGLLSDGDDKEVEALARLRAALSGLDLDADIEV